VIEITQAQVKASRERPLSEEYYVVFFGTGPSLSIRRRKMVKESVYMALGSSPMEEGRSSDFGSLAKKIYRVENRKEAEEALRSFWEHLLSFYVILSPPPLPLHDQPAEVAR